MTAARRTASDAVLDAARGVWDHAAAARFRGGLTAALGGALALALASWRPGDPSFDTSADGTAGNLLGGPGAGIADLLMQGLGLVAWVMAAMMLSLGIGRALSPLPAATRSRLRWRALAGMAGLILLAGGLAGAAAPAMWPLSCGLGGLVGDLEGAVIDKLADLIDFPPAAALAYVLLAIAGLGLCGFALGITREHIFSLFQFRRATVPAKRAPASAKPRTAPVRRPRTQPAAFAAAPVFENDPDPEVDADAPTAPPLAIKTPKAAAKASPRETRESQPSLPFATEETGFRMPELAMLAKSKPRGEVYDEASLRQNAKLLEGVLAEFGVRGQIDQIRPGPVVTLYELVPAPGVKSARVVALCDDIARSMSVAACRVSVVPGRNAIGIELPNPKRETVYLRDLLASPEYEKPSAVLPMALGETIGGEPYIADLAKMPHLLIAGTTGSGKSVGVNAMILSILYRLPPDKCRFIMIDPKMLELSAYDGIPHLLAPVVTDPKKAIVALKWTVREMEDRYRRMSKIGVRNVAGYNDRAHEAIAKGEHFVRTVQTGFDEQGRPVYEEERLNPEPMPYLVVVIDEVADLMMVAGKDIEGAVQRLAQMARAAGIHLIMATQRPSVDVITGTIKANFPTRISFQVTSKIDARTILGEQGAEQLLGQGDMLYMAGGGRITRLHGPFVSDGEVETVAKFLRGQGQPSYIEEVTAGAEDDEDGDGGDPLGGEGGGNDLYDQAVAVVTRDRKASTSYIQRRLQIGYNRAASLMERMEREGVVGAANHAGKREILAGPPP
jgi:S-DNA-T family DNA segregation ATPase FtsK/SpoIIIE